MPMNSYEQNRILSASPVELVRILYTAAVCAVQNARESLRAGDISARSREIGTAQVILLELASSVDPSKGKEVGERLLALYDYMQGRLAEANAEQQDGPLAEVGSLLATLQEAWLQCESPVDEPATAMR
jgi:flagellar protein FliS